MNRSSISLGRILGIPIGVDYSLVLDFCAAHLVAGYKLLSCRICKLARSTVLDCRRGNGYSYVWQCTIA